MSEIPSGGDEASKNEELQVGRRAILCSPHGINFIMGKIRTIEEANRHIEEYKLEIKEIRSMHIERHRKIEEQAKKIGFNMSKETGKTGEILSQVIETQQQMVRTNTTNIVALCQIANGLKMVITGTNIAVTTVMDGHFLQSENVYLSPVDMPNVKLSLPAQWLQMVD